MIGHGLPDDVTDGMIDAAMGDRCRSCGRSVPEGVGLCELCEQETGEQEPIRTENRKGRL